VVVDHLHIASSSAASPEEAFILVGDKILLLTNAKLFALVLKQARK
jgi:hypothetical protein